MPSNKAAWLSAKKATALDVKDAPYNSPGPDQILVKNAAIAVNPADWLIQQKGDMMFTWLKYPFVLGSDVAGEVVEVGKDVKDFQNGDRVLGYAVGADKEINNSAESGFQEYTVLRPNLTSRIPKTMSMERAAVVPLGLGTAAAGLFQKDQLGLEYPTSPPRKPTGQFLIIWGGSTSVGCNAIQLGVAAGYEVVTTASPKNHEYLKKLGASHVFDYRSKTVIKDILAVVKGRPLARAFTIGAGAAEACMEILDKAVPPASDSSATASSGAERTSKTQKFISMATYPMPDPEPKHLVLIRTGASFVSWIAAFKAKGLLKGIKSNFIFASTLVHPEHTEVAKAVFVDFLPRALEAEEFMPAPEPDVVGGKGVEGIQEALEKQQKGVSCSKVVVKF